MAGENRRTRLSQVFGLALACSAVMASGKPLTYVDSAPLDEAYFKLPPLTESSVLGLAGAADKNATSSEKTGARVAYGNVAQPGAWPYIALTLIDMKQGGTSQCASTKIAPRVALTAGHCLDSSGGIDRIRAAFGITNQNEFSSRHVDAYEYTFADFYDGTFFKDDIGLIAFPSEILDAPAVQLSPFPASQLDKTPLYTAGWGLTETQYLNGVSQVSDVLKYAAVPFISNEECGRKYNNWGIVAPPSSHICAGGIKADACMGDSGGPLSIEAAAYPTPGYSTNIQVGITSHGPTPCGGPNNIGAFTDVNQFLRWINDEIWYSNWEGTSIPTVKNKEASPACYTGAVVSTTSLPSGGDCCKACKENLACGSWDYKGTQCVQHATGGFSKGAGACVSGWLDRKLDSPGAQTQPGFFEYPGSSVKVYTLAVSAGGCAVACENLDGCKYYTYIGPIGGSQRYNEQGDNCLLASADGTPETSTRFANAQSGALGGNSPTPSPVPSSPVPSPVPIPSPMPAPSPPPPANAECRFSSGTYIIRSAGTRCSEKYMGTRRSSCSSKSVKMERTTSAKASEFVLKNTGSAATLTAVKFCGTKNKRVTVSSRNSRKTSAYLSRYASAWRFVSWKGDDCSKVTIESVGRARRGYSSFLSRSSSCSRKSISVSGRRSYSNGAWELRRVSSSTKTRRRR